jgi:hypothetical protein
MTDAEPIPVAIRIAEPLAVARPVPTVPVARRGFFRTVQLGVEWLFGLACVVAGLAVLSAVPLAQFLVLGHLLEASGRVARTGRIRDGFIGVRTAGRLGGIVLGGWLFLLPVRIVADFAAAAAIIDPGGPAAANWRIGLIVLTALTFVHVLTAVAHGGKLRYFLWPFNVIWVIRRVLRGGYYSEARDAVWDATVKLRLPHYFLLGLKGFVCGLAWLAVPVTLMAIGQRGGQASGVVGYFGALLLGLVLLYLPFLQTRLAMTNRLRAGFGVRSVRADYRRAPWAFAVAFVVTVLFAVPLYLFKIEVVPREAAWLPGVVFLTFIYPARLLAGWAVGRAQKRRQPRHWFFRWTTRLVFPVAALFYVLVVFLAQYTSWNGVGGLYEQHAFLLPVPLISG